MLTTVIIMTIMGAGEIIMSRRIAFAAASAASLTFGAVLYILFRPHSYIAVFVDGLIDIGTLRQITKSGATAFFRFYFPDFLWSLSFCFCLYAVFDPTRKGILMLTLVAFLCSAAWELMQLSGLVGGTGDMLDVIMYLLAGICAASVGLRSRN